MKEHFTNVEQYHLDSTSIDRISRQIEVFLTDAGAEHREVVRNQLAVECCLENWGELLGSENKCILKTGSRFGHKYLTVESPGLMKDPTNINTESLDKVRKIQMLIDNTGLLSQIGFIPEYYYINGFNTLKIWAPVPKARKSRLKAALLVLLCLAVILVKKEWPSAAQVLFDYAVNPVYSIFVRMLSTICGPLVLFSIVTSICGMGDKASFGLTGSTVILRFMKLSFVLVAITGIALSFFFPIEWIESSETGSGIQSIIQMLVEIVPSDVVSPFASGNALQIVFIGVFLGFTVMYLSNSVSELSNVILQMQRVVIQIMHFLGVLMPYFMVVAIIKLFLSNSFTQIAAILKPVLLIWGGYLLMIVLETIITGISTKTPALKILKSTFGASLIALSTSSSTAAMEKMNENCTKKLGVNENVADFAIPIGQVIFKPAASISFFVCALFAAESAGLAITPVFLLMDFVISWILGTSMAPVSGAMISCMSVLFLQLGIPQDFITLGISISILIDNFGTMTSVQVLQEEVFASDSAVKKSKKQ